ncbi:MAG: hypothetical protein D6689_01015 [Deltaproteobacteria bacterium]|nr:MAG: hypothetical protein D6689_01015 [Deltaproteobacteria bacterium]
MVRSPVWLLAAAVAIAACRNPPPDASSGSSPHAPAAQPSATAGAREHAAGNRASPAAGGSAQHAPPAGPKAASTARDESADPDDPGDPGGASERSGARTDGAQTRAPVTRGPLFGYRPPRPRAARPVEIILRSTPPGAIAAVDGRVVGPTPAYWRGDADGTPHEFTFVLDGYALARYRFVPRVSGVVHATLEPVADADAGP